MTVKDWVRALLKKLDENSTWEDAFENLKIMKALDASLQDIKAGRTIPNDEVMKVFDRYLEPKS